MGLLDQLIAHPDFGKLNPQDKGDLVNRVLLKAPGWNDLSPDDQEDLHSRAYAKAGIPKTFHYDPTEAERVEPGVTQGLQPSMIQPADLLVYPAIGAAEAAGQTALREGTDILGKEALKAGAKAGLAQVPAAMVATSEAQDVAQPAISAIPATTPAGVLARGTAEQLAGVAPFVFGDRIPGQGAASSAWDSIRGATPVARAAREAEEGRVAANLAEQQKLQSKAQTERLAQKESTAAAAEKTGQEGIAKRTIAGEKAATAARTAGLGQRAEVQEAVAGSSTAPSAQDRFADTKAKADAELAEQTQKIQQQAAQEVLPQAKQVAIGEAPASTMEQGPERIARNEQFRENITSPLKQWRGEWGQRRNDLLTPYMNNKPELGQIQGAAQQELNEWQQGRRTFSPKVQAMLQDATQWGIPPPPDDKALLKSMGYPKEEIPGILANAAESPTSWGGNILKEARARHTPPEAGALTVADLLSKQADINKLASMSKGADRTAANVVSRSIDEALSGVAPTPELKALNAEYRDHREHFPYQFEDAINSSARPVDTAAHIFNEPERALDLARLGDENTKGSMRELYAQWVNENGDKVIDPSHAAFLKEIAPGTPYADPKAWVYEKKAQDHLQSVIDSSPEVKARWEGLIKQDTQAALDDYYKGIAKFAFQDAGRFGPIGDRLITSMRGKTPEQQAQLASEFYSKLTPEQAQMAVKQPSPEQAAGGAITELKATQKTPQRAAYEAQIAAPRTARQALQAYQPKDPSEAAIQAIQGHGYKPSWLSGSATRRLAWTIPGAIGGAVTYGHPSGYAIGALAVDAPIWGREALVKSFQESLRDPVEARRFYQAITNPGTKSNFEFLASQAAKAGVALAAENAGVSMATPQSTAPANSPAKPGPAIKALHQTRAEHLAPTPSASKRAVKVSTDVSRGKNPEVTHDLNRGRLSMDETNKLIQHASADDPMAMVQGVSLQDAMDALDVANPHERALLMPMVEQRLRKELPQEKNKTLQMKLAQRFKRLQSMPEQQAEA